MEPGGQTTHCRGELSEPVSSKVGCIPDTFMQNKNNMSAGPLTPHPIYIYDYYYYYGVTLAGSNEGTISLEGQEKRKGRKTQKSKSEEKVMGFSSASLYLTRK